MKITPQKFENQKVKSKLFIGLFFTMAFALTSNFSFAQTINSNIKITNNDKLNSEAFKAKVGVMRLLDFKKLENLIIPKSTNTVAPPVGAYFIGEYAMTEAGLILLLGIPDFKVSNVIYQYNLGITNSACKLYVGIDSDGFISYSVIKSCN